MTASSLIGQSLLKPDALDKALGRTQYGVDLKPREALVAKVLRSPYAHARLVSIDVSRARQLPGVGAVVTGQDIPDVRWGRWVQDRTILARDEVRHIGEPVAAVAAVDEETAEEALELISVEYDELPPLLDPEEAMKPGAPLVHAGQEEYQPLPPVRHCHGNVLHSERFRKGDVARALAQADLVYRASYRATPIHHGITQPHEAVVALDVTGKLTIWSTTKAPFIVRQLISRALGLPMSRLRVIATAMGGDFGARGNACIEPLCVLLALHARRPVALALTREEEFFGTFLREDTYVELEVGARKDGTLLAVRGRLLFDSGAYHDSANTLASWVGGLVGPYRVPNFDLEGYIVYTHNPPRGHVRAPRGPSVMFAVESHLDMVAHKLGLDPVELRLRNAVESEDALPEGPVVHNVGFKKTLYALSVYLKGQRGTLPPHQAWGVAAGMWGLHPQPREGPRSSATVKVNEDGTAVLITGVADQGAGQHTLLAQIVAEVLAIPFEAVSIVAADTDVTPYEQGTGGSQTTYRAGTQVKLAAQDARRQLLGLAAQRLKVKEADLVLEAGKVYALEAPEVSVSLATLATAAISSRGGPIMGTSARYREELMAAMAPFQGTVDFPAYVAQAALVEADPETGKVKVLRYFAAQDVGRALNPKLIEAQIEGSVGFALGQALSEEVVLDHGRVLNPSLMDYHQPTAADVPGRIDMVLVEEPSRFGPWGAKGVGEPSTVPVPAAIANAVFRAVGARVTTLPLTPDRVVQALKVQ